MNKISKFIKENNLDFSGTGSGLNSSCVIISGFALYLGIEDSQIVIDVMNNNDVPLDRDQANEFTRVFDFAYSNDYGHNWRSQYYQNMYKYEVL